MHALLYQMYAKAHNIAIIELCKGISDPTSSKTQNERPTTLLKEPRLNNGEGRSPYRSRSANTSQGRADLHTDESQDAYLVRPPNPKDLLILHVRCDTFHHDEKKARGPDDEMRAHHYELRLRLHLGHHGDNSQIHRQ